ncbi:MAG: hypothetical protein NPMRTH1_270017 [Nitrosopumilales archaeon]|nr:MAG: hypothetical protein NPMRTH1_270017 [Nitrosopumilales archaeon]
MKKYNLGIIFGLKNYIIISLGILSFSQLVVQLFGQTIPNIIWTFFRDAGAAIVLAAVFVFALTWLLRARPHNRPKKYLVIMFDVYGKESKIEGVRTEFKTHDVGWSFMKQYKKSFPLYNFALVSDMPKSNKKTIFKYL